MSLVHKSKITAAHPFKSGKRKFNIPVLLIKNSTSITLLPISLDINTRISMTLHISFVKAIILINFLIRLIVYKSKQLDICII